MRRRVRVSTCIEWHERNRGRLGAIEIDSFTPLVLAQIRCCAVGVHTYSSASPDNLICKIAMHEQGERKQVSEGHNP
jgi:hypothetical protein